MSLGSPVFSSDPSLKENYDIISEAINAILNKRMSNYSFQQIYHSVFNLCQRKCSAPLFDHLLGILSAQVVNIRDRLLSCNEETFLQNLNSEWNAFSGSVLGISRVLLYLNNNYTRNGQTIQQMGENLFSTFVLKNQNISEVLIQCVRKSLSSDTVSRMALREISIKLCKHYRDTLYEPYIEDPLITVLKEEYRVKMNEMLNKMDTNQYLIWALDVIERTKLDVSALVGEETCQRVEQNLGLLLIKENTEKLLYSLSGGGTEMIRDMDIKSLGRLVMALEKVNETEACLSMLITTARKMGAELLNEKDHEFPVVAVEKVLTLREKLQGLVENLSGIPKGDKSPVVQAITEIVNDNSDFAEKLAYYYDAKIKSRPPRETLEKIAADTFSLFRLLRSKETFEHIFKLLLATRLINSKPDYSFTDEFFLIEKLRNECGDSVVNHLEIMMNDGKVREEINKGFLSYACKKRELPLDFNVLVITSGVWPEYTNLSIDLPLSMQSCIQLFRAYYLPHYNARKLLFHKNLGTVFFTLNHGKKYELAAPTAFVNTILCFQNREKEERLTLQQICCATKLVESDVLPQLESLCSMGLITVELINGSPVYIFNQSFTNHKTKLRIRATSGSKAIEDHTEERTHHESLESSHSSKLQAVLVQIMKKNKFIEHSELCNRVFEFLQGKGFVPSMTDIKKSLETLMSKGFISRGSRPDTYVYES
ncbi:putative cullin-like protein [Trypanosoma theileri]|uniref:Putative cullin-like protein n=1 Tax=Trypanosoma theileri TaxID=67003 RepID=A0A1X0NKJ9_9TRYP|nr:putative cullin-like protein [Trypanosoma theileri]ORC85216.1 putative cullin-like protein [Trypanosoma theileri]